MFRFHLDRPTLRLLSVLIDDNEDIITCKSRLFRTIRNLNFACFLVNYGSKLYCVLTPGVYTSLYNRRGA